MLELRDFAVTTATMAGVTEDIPNSHKWKKPSVLNRFETSTKHKAVAIPVIPPVSHSLTIAFNVIDIVRLCIYFG